MKEITTHFAEAHLSKLLKEAQRGETIIIPQGRVPVGKLVAVSPPYAKRRPRPGTATSAAVTCLPDAFTPRNDTELMD